MDGDTVHTAVLLAAGRGTRLWPITRAVPKCLVPIQGQTLLDIWIDHLHAAGVSRVLINTHYFADQVRAHLARRSTDVAVELFHEESLLGTAGTLRALAPTLRQGTFLCAHADNLTWFDVDAMVERHLARPKEVDITMLTFDTDRPECCGIVQEDAGGLVQGFFEKQPNPPGRRANGAVYLMEPAVLDFIARIQAPDPDLSLDVLPHYLGRMQTWWAPDTYLRDIGTPEALQRGVDEWRAIVARQKAVA